MTESLHALAAPYALDAVDDLDRRRFEAHLDDCETCADELSGFAITASRLGSAQAVIPSEHLRGRILAAAAVSPQRRSFAPRPRRSTWRRLLPAIAVAAALVVPTAAAAEFVTERENTADTRASSESVSSVLAAPDASTRSTSLTGGGTVRIVSSAARDAAVVAADQLPALPTGQTYQVWTLTGTDATSHGTFDTSTLVSADRLGKADRVAVTVEPRGGSEQPTTAPVATLSL